MHEASGANFLWVTDVRLAISANRQPLWRSCVGQSFLAVLSGGGTGYGLAEGFLEGAKVAYQNFPNNTLAAKAVNVIAENSEYVGYLPLVFGAIGAIAVSIALYRKDKSAISNAEQISKVLGNENRLITNKDLQDLNFSPDFWKKILSDKRQIATDQQRSDLVEQQLTLCQRVLVQICEKSIENTEIYKQYTENFEEGHNVESKRLDKFLAEKLTMENLSVIWGFAIENGLEELKGKCLEFSKSTIKDI